MAVESLRTVSSVPYQDGYEHVVAVATVALDPADPANAAIVDLDRARRDPDGLVRFETDVVLLRAPEPGGLLHVVANRGLVTGLPYSAGLARVAPTGQIEAGDGWVLRRGLSVLWVGWQWDIERRPGTVGLDAPEALGDGGEPLRGQARLGFQPVTGQARRRLADEVLPIMGQFQALAAADPGEPGATLTERDFFNGPRRTVPRDRWRFTDPEHIELDGGFAARRHYELTYTTSRCPVAGAGLAAVRDVVTYLRDQFTHTLAFGVSQSGRWLRQFVRDTGNAAESGARVFDGIHCHIAGGRVGEFNNRYAQPSSMNPLGFCHLPPFSPADGLLDRTRAHGTAPKLVFTNTATEYWRGDASLGHPDPDDPGCRWYLYAGTHHVGTLPGYVEALPVQLPGNLVDTTGITRAHAAALQEWVRDGTPPPASAVPRPDGTGISRDEALKKLRAAPWLRDITLPAGEALLGMPPISLGPDETHGVARYPAVVLGPARPCLVSDVDDDGNELAGVRLPHVSVPLDVSAGWNPELPRDGVPVETWNLAGGRVPLPAAEVLRRYGDAATFLARVRADAESLVGARHLLADDLDAVLADARRRWDAAVPPPS
ncbi:MAG TPA: alpha/beta hydrolase domain-containing protein [Streptosporangiaceae bacterium]